VNHPHHHIPVPGFFGFRGIDYGVFSQTRHRSSNWGSASVLSVGWDDGTGIQGPVFLSMYYLDMSGSIDSTFNCQFFQSIISVNQIYVLYYSTENSAVLD
jgi:hypothetical protein